MAARMSCCQSRYVPWICRVTNSFTFSTQANYGADHLDVAGALNNMGSAHRARGDCEEAAQCFTRALVIFK